MIQVESVSRRYGEVQAVDGVSFEIGCGEIVGLLGHNGAGKTTIMKMLSGCLEPTSGHIAIDGRDLSKERRDVQKIIGYLPENGPLYPEMTVIGFLDYVASLHLVPQEKRVRMIREAMEKTALAGKANERIRTLSKGYRQRMGVAQAILHDPKVLILDEPTNGLDPTQIRHMRELIRELARKSTVIVSTHILQEVRASCDRVIVMRDGKKALDKAMAELWSKGKLYLELDAEPVQAIEILETIGGIRSVQVVRRLVQEVLYLIEITDEFTLKEVAPEVARRVTERGIKMFSLQPEKLDLETVFGEIALR